MAYTQGDRRFQIVTEDWDENLLNLEEATITETISGLYNIQLSLFSEQVDIAFDKIIGMRVAVRMGMEKGGGIEERFMHGIVSSFSQGQILGGFATYRAEVVPWFWYLTRSSDCAIYQDMTIPDIVKSVFDELGFDDYDCSPSGDYAPREYCVQYRETHFNFISRLLEESGISYCFKHEIDKHTMVLIDDPAQNPEAPYGASAKYGADEAGESADILHWHSEQRASSGKYAIDDYNFKDPSVDLLANATNTIEIAGNERFEVFELPR